MRSFRYKRKWSNFRKNANTTAGKLIAINDIESGDRE